MKIFNFTNSPKWDFQRSGWKYVIYHLKKNFHNDNGLPFYDWADGEFIKNKPILHEWSGILHNVISYPPDYYLRKDIRIICLKDLVEKPFFQKSIDKCKLLFTLSPTTAKFLNSKGIKCQYFFHPCQTTTTWNCFNGKIITIGQWLRKIEAISEIDTKFSKIILKVPWEEPYKNLRINSNIKIKNYLKNKEYDQLMSESLVFLNMHDVAACNTIIECIMNNIPILINRLDGAKDYLGNDYPLFYDSIDNVKELLTNEKIIKGHLYLKNKNKENFYIKNTIFYIKKIIEKSFDYNLKIL